MGFCLAFLILRAWPLAGIITGFNAKADPGPMVPEAAFIPPSSVPAEIRSGCSHPHFDFEKLLAEIIFKPRAVRHGHVFRCNDPALSPQLSGQLATILSDPATYEPWSGEKMCGGFRGDWNLRWADDHEAIICEGCAEILLYRNGRSIRCDLGKTGYERIVAITHTPGTR